MADCAFSSLNASTFFCFSDAIVTRISCTSFSMCNCNSICICICLWGKNLLHYHLSVRLHFSAVAHLWWPEHHELYSNFICHCIHIHICGRGKNCNSISGCVALFMLLHLNLRCINGMLLFKSEPLASGCTEPAIFGQVHPHIWVPWYKSRQEQQYLHRPMAQAYCMQLHK